MKIIIDQAIPFIEGVFEPYAEVEYHKGECITPEVVKDADALIIRTRTRCNAELLENSSVKMIATATIGTDHIDLPYCKENGIFVQNAAGCNAGGVMNYVFSALFGVASRKGLQVAGSTIGIIGVGSVGSRVENMAKNLGFQVLRCDPPRAAAEGEFGFCDLDTLLETADVVTMHVPLNETTKEMANEDFFRKMKKGAIFINAARGEIMNDDALKQAIPKLGATVIDTWNHEPDIDMELLDMVDIATPHIAGYSYQGKQRGTSDAVRAVARYFSLAPIYEFFPTDGPKELEAVKLDVRGKTQGEIAAAIQYNYPIFTDDFLFRMEPEKFEHLRSHYSYRREFFID
ncbi:MAG: 4-phosphoerythronate dehydrogenase [Bacteroidales bacterium]|nr:4-phosphoerythronate dehydrogenase [Bacteroidales bacterium]